MLRLKKPFRQLASKPHPRKRLRKRPYVENEIVDNNPKMTVGDKLLGKQSRMRTKSP